MLLLWTAIAIASPREDALQVVDAAQHDEYRAAYTVTLPKSIVLPASYKIRMFGKEIAHPELGWRLDLVRDAAGARAELLNQRGLHRVHIPPAELDHAVHVGLYLGKGTAVREDGTSSSGGGSGSHMAIRSVQGLVTMPEVLAWDTDLRKHTAFEDFAQVWLVLELEKVARQHLTSQTALPITAAMRDGWRDALGAAGAERFAGTIGPPAYEGLLAHLLAVSGEERFLPVLDAVGASDQAAGLRVLLLDGDDVAGGLVAPLCGEWKHSREALARASQLGDGARPAYLEALKCDLHESRIVELIHALSALDPDPATDSAIDALLETEVTEEIRVAGLRARWRTSGGDDVYLDALEAFAREGELTIPKQIAYGVLVGAALADESRKPKIARQLAARLDAMTLGAHPTYSGKDSLISQLGRVGGPEQLSTIRRYLDASPGTPEVEIHALLAIEPSAGVDAVVKQLDLYVEGEGSYRWLVWPFFDLLVCEDMGEAVEPLRRGRPRLKAETRTHGWSLEPHDALIAYLASSQGRAELGAAFIEAEGTRLSMRARSCLTARHPDLTPERVEVADEAAKEASNAEHQPWGVPWRD